MADNQNYPILTGALELAAGTLTVPEENELLHCRMERIRLLRKERDPVLQAELYRQLQYFSSRLPDGIGAVQPLQAYTPALERDDQLLQRFWTAIEQLQVQGLRLNHSHQVNTLALHLNTLGPLLAPRPYLLDVDGDLKRSLRKSVRPQFIKSTKVHSVITGKTVHCWCFHVSPDSGSG